MKSKYTHKSLPWVSKSKINNFNWCKYKFKRTEIDGVRYDMGVQAKRGIYLHEIFNMWFDVIDFEELWNLEWRSVGAYGEEVAMEYTPVYRYFESKMYKIASELIGEEESVIRTDFFIKINVKGFLSFEYDHWMSIRNTFDNKHKCRSYFIPGTNGREKFYMDENFKMYGRLDRINRDYGPKKTVLIDYKTGRIPKAGRENKRSASNNLYTVGMPTSKSKEGHFYMILWLLNRGYEFNLVEGSDGKERIYPMYNGKITKVKEVEFAFLFTNGSKTGKHDNRNYIITRFRFNNRSMRSVFNNIEEIRNCDNFTRRDDHFWCPNCEFFKPECSDYINDVELWEKD